jgi:hypothetical protein
MRKRLALVAFEQGEGPWLVAKGDEDRVAVGPVLEGEQVSLVVDGPTPTVIHCEAGLTSVTLRRSQRYRFVKQVREGITPSKTCVEVLLYEQSSGRTDS